jgi:hypothetical protein
MNKALNVEFHEIEAAPGVVDIAIRYDTKTGSYNFVIEETGLPTTLPLHVFNGILFSILNEACKGTIEGYRYD